MTPQEALALLDAAVSQMQLNRRDHTQLARAVQVLQALIEKEQQDGSTSA